MGYSIYLVDKEKPITEDILDEIVMSDSFPDRLKGPIFSKQGWGWLTRCDLTIREKDNISFLNVSGSFGISGKWATDMVVVLQQMLQKRGHKIEIYSSGYDFAFENKEIEEWLNK